MSSYVTKGLNDRKREVSALIESARSKISVTVDNMASGLLVEYDEQHVGKLVFASGNDVTYPRLEGCARVVFDLGG